MKRIVTSVALSLLLSACGSVVPEASKRQSVARSTAVITSRPDARQCLAQLGATQANFTPMPDRYFAQGCSTLNSVQLAGLRSDDAMLSLANLGPVTCPLASTFAAWARYGVDRAARQMLGSPLVRIETMGSYSCRNVAGTARRSGHASANAIDVSAFVLADGRRVPVLGGWSGGSAAERKFLRTVHASACKRFGTSLGPDYNAAHANHFHVEVNGDGYCR